jgi:hypothetical protein
VQDEEIFSYRENLHRQSRDVYGGMSRRRCRGTGCFCMMTRLQVNIVVRHLIRSDPSRRSKLRSFRLLREANRRRRRIGREITADMAVTIDRPYAFDEDRLDF